MTEPESRAEEDPYLWLEEIDGAESLAWVTKKNEQSRAELASLPEFAATEKRLLGIFNAQGRIPMVAARGGLYYNFWQDEVHVRGVWRRTTAADYRSLEPSWEILLDIDALARAENENWVFKGAQCLYPGFDRALISLSRGGGDAHVVREYDLTLRRFVTDGFELPEAKGSLNWIERDQVYVATDFGPGTLTDSGYPRQIKRWHRGTPLASAELLFEASETDMIVWAERTRDWVGGELVVRDFIHHRVTFYSGAMYLLGPGGKVRLALPEDAEIETFADQLIVTLRSAWAVQGTEGERIWPQGAALAIGLDAFVSGGRDFTAIYTPGPRKSLAGLAALHDALIVNELDQLRPRAFCWRVVQGRWTSVEWALPEGGSATLSGVDPDTCNECFLIETSPIKPTSLSWIEADPRQPVLLKTAPAFFDATGMQVVQHNAVSADGTLVPYCLVTPQGFSPGQDTPTLLYAYGGFEVTLLPPAYSPAVGAAWLEQGGAYAIAGLRGGGEFGPAWHQASLKENRQRCYDDLVGVACDLIERRVTTPAHLAIEGGSNGGLLVGAVMVQRPELFRAVVCNVPLLDMRRYHRLLAGASWIGEYGDPDNPAEWAFISRYSPYQNVRAGVTYPEILLMTSTRDDRVHPGHARKMAAKLEAVGARVHYYENIEGGHAGAADNLQAAFMDALSYTFLQRVLR